MAPHAATRMAHAVDTEVPPSAVIRTVTTSNLSETIYVDITSTGRLRVDLLQAKTVRPSDIDGKRDTYMKANCERKQSVRTDQ